MKSMDRTYRYPFDEEFAQMKVCYSQILSQHDNRQI